MINVVGLVPVLNPSSRVASQTDFFGVPVTVQAYLQGTWTGGRGNADSFRGKVQDWECVCRHREVWRSVLSAKFGHTEGREDMDSVGGLHERGSGIRS